MARLYAKPYSLPSALEDYRKYASESSEGEPGHSAVIAWDTEVIDEGDEKIFEICLREVFPRRREDARELPMLINPGRGLPNGSIRGVSNRELRKMRTFAEAWPRIRNFVESFTGPNGERPILVAHNGENFDSTVLDTELMRLEREMPNWHFACSIEHISKAAWPDRECYSLPALLEMLGIENEAEHTAAGDARALALMIEAADDDLRLTSRTFYSSYKKGDAVRFHIFDKLNSTATKPKKFVPPPTRSTGPEKEAERKRENAKRLDRLVPGGGSFCVPDSEVFHAKLGCSRLSCAKRIYEIDGPPSDRRECRYCGMGVRANGSGISAEQQFAIFDYLRSSPSCSSNSLSSSTATTANTPVKLHANTRAKVSTSQKTENKSIFHTTGKGKKFHKDPNCWTLRGKKTFPHSERPKGLGPCKACAMGRKPWY